jgi:hypothetical protein
MFSFLASIDNSTGVFNKSKPTILHAYDQAISLWKRVIR